MAIILLKLYKISLSFFDALKAGILKSPGSRFNPNGYSIDKPNVIKVSSIKIN